ncbi:MAG: ribosomal protein S18-alanine N-acetyltransferase [Hyphomicrobium sp.]
MSDNVTPFRNIKHVSLLWADPERAAEIAALHARLFNPSWDRTAIKTLLEHPASTSLVAVSGSPKLAVGFIIGQLAADQAEIISVAVAPEWQRVGLGRMLVEGLARASRRGDAERLFLEVAEDNVSALALYRSLSFKEVARRKGYYQRSSAPPVDGLVLSLAL